LLISVSVHRIIDSIYSLEARDVLLVRSMKEKAAQLITNARLTGKIPSNIPVRIGFHAIPMMRQLRILF
jgi:hypothetical protein